MTAPDDLRSLLLAGLLAQVPAVQVYAQRPTEADDDPHRRVVEFYLESGLDTQIAQRRAQTAAVWAAALTGSGPSAATIAAEAMTARSNATAIAAALAERRRREQAAAAPKLCASCFVALPVTVRCDDCNWAPQTPERRTTCSIAAAAGRSRAGRSVASAPSTRRGGRRPRARPAVTGRRACLLQFAALPRPHDRGSAASRPYPAFPEHRKELSGTTGGSIEATTSVGNDGRPRV